MLYYDDFMEAIESLPTELNENLIAVRHLDFQAQNTTEPLSSRINAFFENCKYMRLSEREKEAEYQKILSEFDMARDYSKRKEDIVNSLHDMYQKLMRKLDGELEKFRLELEADNSGVTSKIEHRVKTLLGLNMPTNNRLDKRRSKIRAGHLFNANRVLSKRRPAYGPDGQERPYFVLKRRFAAFDTSPVPLPLDSSYNGNSVSFLPEESSGALISDGSGRILGSEGLRRISSTDSLDSMNMPDNDFTAFQADDQEFCDDDLRLTVDSTKRSRTLGTPQRSTGTSSDVPSRDSHRSHHPSGATSCYSPFIAPSDNEAVTIPTSAMVDQSIDDLLATPTPTSASPIIKRGESPRWFGGSSSGAVSSSAADKHRRVVPMPLTSRNPGPSRRPSRASTTTAESIDDGADYLSANEVHYRYSPARSIKDHHGSRQESFNMLGSGGGGGSGSVGAANGDERRYCFCNDVSYGEMIACDAPTCRYEWFHYGCVGLAVAPRGSWYCPECTQLGRYPGSAAHVLTSNRKRSTHRR